MLEWVGKVEVNRKWRGKLPYSGTSRWRERLREGRKEEEDGRREQSGVKKWVGKEEVNKVNKYAEKLVDREESQKRVGDNTMM